MKNVNKIKIGNVGRKGESEYRHSADRSQRYRRQTHIKVT